MADERTTLDDLRALIDRNHDDSTRQFTAINDRVERLESRRSGHSTEQIVQIVDDRLEHILPNIIRKAVSDELSRPLKRVDESIDASRRNREAIQQVQNDLQPLLEIRDGIVFLKRFIVGAGSLGSAGLVIWAVASGVAS